MKIKLDNYIKSDAIFFRDANQLVIQSSKYNIDIYRINYWDRTKSWQICEKVKTPINQRKELDAKTISYINVYRPRTLQIISREKLEMFLKELYNTYKIRGEIINEY